MEDTQMSWQDSNDVLQGIMVGHDGLQPQSNLLDFRQSALALDESACNPLLELHLPDFASLETQSQPFVSNQWFSEPQDFYYTNYSSSCLASHQDAWSPLQVTGVPNSSSVSHMSVSTMADPDCGLVKPHYSTPSESGSQYMGSFHSADSGYGAHSVITSSYGVDSMSSPQIAAQEHGFGETLAVFDRSHVGTAPLFDYSSSCSPDATVKCDHPSCSWVGKCPSDKRKHEARHRKLFKCDEPNCSRKEGFGTINDLARHKKCVHNREPERGPKMMYLCFGKNCPRPNKKWPRLDNFKQHLNRMHNEEDADALLKESMDWYENIMGRQSGDRADDTMSQSSTLVDAQQDLETTTAMELEFNDAVHQAPAPDSCDFPSTQAVISEQSQHNTHHATPLHTHTSQSPNLGSTGLDSSPSSDRNDPTRQRGNIKAETFVADAADNLIYAMTKMMNNRGRRSGQQSDEGIEIEPGNPQLSQSQRQMLQKVLSAALERLSDDASSTASDPSDEKNDWFQCDICFKRTRLRCEMKKHQKRHERPYGCTFPHCAKSFGSKADWKRHESSQHLHVQSWLCVSHDTVNGAVCGRVFYRGETYTQHLSQQHLVPRNRIRAFLNASRLDLADQLHFWCGFCNKTIPLQCRGSAALDERFNHIDVEHFKKGEKGRDWCFPVSEDLSGQEKTLKAVMAGPSQIPEKNSRKRKFLG